MNTQLDEHQVLKAEVLNPEESEQLLSDLALKERDLKEFAERAAAAAEAAEKALRNANQAKEAADFAKVTANSKLKIGVIFNKSAISSVSDRVTDVAKAVSSVASSQVDLAKAQADLTKAQKISLECQKKLATISVEMVKLGCASIANSRTVVRQLEARLQGADDEELNELARIEINNVLKQIKEQQDIMGRQLQTERILRDHRESLRETSRIDEAQNKRIDAQESIIGEHQKVLMLQSKRCDEIEQTLKQHEKVAQSMQEAVSLNAGLLQEHFAQFLKHREALDETRERLSQQSDYTNAIDHRLESVSATVHEITGENMRQDETLTDHEDRVAVLEKEITQKNQEIQELQKKLDDLHSDMQTKADKVLLWILGSAGVLGFILSLTQFLI